MSNDVVDPIDLSDLINGNPLMKKIQKLVSVGLDEEDVNKIMKSWLVKALKMIIALLEED